MNTKLLSFLLIMSSLIGYLEWGTSNHGFLFQLEGEVLKKLFENPMEAIHPFTVLPLLGQILLLVAIFKKGPAKGLTIAGMACIGVLMLMLFIIGVLGPNFKILLSTLPFFIAAFLAIRNFRKSRQ